MPGRPSGANKKQKAGKEGERAQQLMRGGVARIIFSCNTGGGLGHRTLVWTLAMASTAYTEPQF